MNNKLLVLLLLLATVLFSACNKEPKPQKITVNNGEGSLSLDALAREGTLTIKATNSWHVTTAANTNWVELSSRSGAAGTSTIKLSLDKNTGAPRTTKLVFTSSDAITTFRVSQSGTRVGFDDTDYNFYFTLGTMPTLYAGLYILTEEKPSWFFYSRGNTFDPGAFPAWCQVLNIADPVANVHPDNVIRTRKEMMQQVKALNAADPTAVFGLYVDDLRCRQGYDWFVAQGIDSTRVRVRLLSDGTATYNNFFNYFGDPATAEQNWTRYANEVEALDWNHGGGWPESRSKTEDAKIDSWTWAFYLATRPGYQLVMQHGDLLEATSPYMTERLAELQIESVQPFELLESLSAERQQQFYRMAKFDYAHFETIFDASPKRNLIIIGTNPGGDAQRAYVKQVMTQYGDNHDIFFKPHPADVSSADYETRFPGLKLLPGQMPFEIFVWALLPKIDLIGGYPSTTYLTVPVEKVGFIFAPNAASLVRPLNILFTNATHVEWLQ